MNRKTVTNLFVLGAMVAFALPTLVRADSSDSQGAQQCPVGLVSGLTLDQEFGPGASMITRCIKKRRHVRVMFQINRFCSDSTVDNETMSPFKSTCTSPYALGQMVNVINDYEITEGMKPSDFKMIAVAYGKGGFLLLKGNPYQSQVEALMKDGVHFYFCQNTARGFIKAGLLPNPQTTGMPAADGLIPGVTYVTAGVSTVLDFQALGWSSIAP
ncbi:MAG: DsrE family protein [Acidiferrobacterales bacterium]